MREEGKGRREEGGGREEEGRKGHNTDDVQLYSVTLMTLSTVPDEVIGETQYKILGAETSPGTLRKEANYGN